MRGKILICAHKLYISHVYNHFGHSKHNFHNIGIKYYIFPADFVNRVLAPQNIHEIEIHVDCGIPSTATIDEYLHIIDIFKTSPVKRLCFVRAIF